MRKIALLKFLPHTALALLFAMPAIAAKVESDLFDLSLDELVNVEIVTARKITLTHYVPKYGFDNV